MTRTTGTWRHVGVGRAFLVLAWLAVAAVVVQVFLAGYALLVDPSAWAWHTSFVHAVESLPFLMALLAWLGKGPRRLLALSLALVGLIWIQYLFVQSPVGFVRALHPTNALAIFAVALLAARDAAVRFWSPPPTDRP